MTLSLDTSALLRRLIDGPGRDVVVEAMAADADWCASALAWTEVHLALGRATTYEPGGPGDLLRSFRRDWDAVAVVPLDRRCLARAVEIGDRTGVATDDALHLAAADRLPRPVTYLTFSAAQIPAALDLGFDVVSSVGS